MSDLFLGGDSSGGRQTRNGVAVCSQKRALCVTAIVLAALLGTALVIAYAGPQNGERNQYKFTKKKFLGYTGFV